MRKPTMRKRWLIFTGYISWIATQSLEYFILFLKTRCVLYYKSYYAQYNDESWIIQRWENQRWENDTLFFTTTIVVLNIWMQNNIIYFMSNNIQIQRWENQLFYHRWANVPFRYTLHIVHYTQYNDESFKTNDEKTNDEKTILYFSPQL